MTWDRESWYDASYEGKRSEVVFEQVARLEQDQSDAMERMARLYWLYDPEAENSGDTTGTTRSRAQQVVQNLIASNVDTVCAIVTATDIRPRILTDDADWSLQRKAEHCSWYGEALGKKLELHAKCAEAFRLGGAIKGIGLVQVDLDRRGQIFSEMVHPDDIIVSRDESHYGYVFQMHRAKVVDARKLAAEYPDFKEEITHARGGGRIQRNWPDYRPVGKEQVAVIESYNPDNPENVRNGTADRYMHEVYALGKPARREGAVFGNWEITDEWPSREFCERSAWGVDFGFSMDPTTLVAAKVHGRTLFLREYIYETGLLVAPPDTAKHTPSLIGRMREMLPAFHPDDWIYCDSAQPESIRQLQIAGFHTQAVKKGPGSIIAGIQRLKRFQIKIHRGSVNLQREFRMHSWRKRPDGTYADEPEDRYNHAIDACRYASVEFKITNNADPIYIAPEDQLADLVHKLRARHDATRRRLNGEIEEGAIRI